MAMSCRYAARGCSRQLRLLSPSRTSSQISPFAAPSTRRWNTTETTDPKITQLVDQISSLTLLETASLVSTLKTKLNLPDMPMGGFVAAAPGAAAAPAAAAAEEEPEEAAPAQAERTVFNLKMESFEAASKAKIIKEVKSFLGLSLVESKKFVESTPKMMKENVAKEEAESIIAKMKELGAKVTME